MSSVLTQTPRSRVKRLHERGRYDFDSVAGILDGGFLCHVGYVIDGKPYVTPTSYWREGDQVYWHGSSASRMLRTVAGGVEVCLTVAHVDGLVLARSASITPSTPLGMLFGRGAQGQDPAEAPGARRTSSSICTRREGTARGQRSELKATTILYMPIDEGAAKMRTGQR